MSKLKFFGILLAGLRCGVGWAGPDIQEIVVMGHSNDPGTAAAQINYVIYTFYSELNPELAALNLMPADGKVLRTLGYADLPQYIQQGTPTAMIVSSTPQSAQYSSSSSSSDSSTIAPA